MLQHSVMVKFNGQLHVYDCERFISTLNFVIEFYVSRFTSKIIKYKIFVYIKKRSIISKVYCFLI